MSVAQSAVASVLFIRLLLSALLILRAADATTSADAWGFDLISPAGYVTGLGPLERIYSTTVEACAAACLGNSQCGGFDWDTKDFDCQLESVNYEDAVAGGHYKEDNGDWVFYSLNPTRNFELIAEKGYVNGLGPLERMYSTTLAACAQGCEANPSCGGFDWDTKDFDCQLESVNYEEAVAGGNWKADNGDWVFYSLTTTTSTTTSTTLSTTATFYSENFELIAEKGYVTGLGPLARLYSTTREECASQCEQNPSCGGFDWDTKDFDCQLESVNYEEAVAGGHWKADNGDWVFYTLITTSTTTTATPEPCLKFCEMTKKNCFKLNNKKTKCKASYMSMGSNQYAKCKWTKIVGSFGICQPNPSSLLTCPSDLSNQCQAHSGVRRLLRRQSASSAASASAESQTIHV